MQQARLIIEEAAQDRDLKMKRELELITNEKIALREDVKMTTNDFADRFGSVERHMATVLGNAQLSNTRIPPQKAEKTTASRNSQYNHDESSSSYENWDLSATKYESDRSSMEKEDTLRQRERKTKKEGSIKHAKEDIFWFKKRGPKHLVLKEIKPSNSLYKTCCSTTCTGWGGSPTNVRP